MHRRVARPHVLRLAIKGDPLGLRGDYDAEPLDALQRLRRDEQRVLDAMPVARPRACLQRGFVGVYRHVYRPITDGVNRDLQPGAMQLQHHAVQ